MTNLFLPVPSINPNIVIFSRKCLVSWALGPGNYYLISLYQVMSTWGQNIWIVNIPIIYGEINKGGISSFSWLLFFLAI